jgi:hypothetical protein
LKTLVQTSTIGVGTVAAEFPVRAVTFEWMFQVNHLEKDKNIMKIKDGQLTTKGNKESRKPTRTN